jgi:hypothetical protein
MKMSATTGSSTALATPKLCLRASRRQTCKQGYAHGPFSRAEILIANARLKIKTSNRKQRLLQISNRERIAIFSLVSPPFSASAAAFPSSFNRQFGKLKNQVSHAISVPSEFLIGTRSLSLRMLPHPSFSPRQTISRDMIPALTPPK